MQRLEVLFLEPDLDLHEDFARDEQRERPRCREHEKEAQQVHSHGEKDGVALAREQAVLDKLGVALGVDTDAPRGLHLDLGDQQPHERDHEQHPTRYGGHPGPRHREGSQQDGSTVGKRQEQHDDRVSAYDRLEHTSDVAVVA